MMGSNVKKDIFNEQTSNALKEMVSGVLAEMACVIGKSLEDVLNASKMSKDDGEQDGQTDVKTCVFEG